MKSSISAFVHGRLTIFVCALHMAAMFIDMVTLTSKFDALKQSSV